MQPADQGAGSASVAVVVILSKQRLPEMPGIVHLKVPLLHNTTPEVCKKVQIFRQEAIDLRVTINRNCLFAHDLWEQIGEQIDKQEKTLN